MFAGAHNAGPRDDASTVITSFDIRLAVPGDAQEIALMSRREIEQGLRWSWTMQRVSRAIASRQTNVIVAQTVGVIAGFALMEYRAEDAHLLLLAVRPEQRRQGIATAMLKWLEETLLVAGIDKIQVEVRATNPVAQAFYAKLGYEPVQATRGYYQGIESAIHLVKELRPDSMTPGEPG